MQWKTAVRFLWFWFIRVRKQKQEHGSRISEHNSPRDSLTEGFRLLRQQIELQSCVLQHLVKCIYTYKIMFTHTHTVPAVNQGTRTRSKSTDYYYPSLYNIQQGLAAHSQGAGCACGSEQWMLWLLALLIPPYSAWANLQEQSCSSSSVLIDLPQPEEHWDSPQLSQLLSAPPHTCRPTLASSEKLQGLHPTFFFFLLNSFRHTGMTHISVYLLSLLAELRVDGGCILCMWAGLSLLPLLTQTNTFVVTGIMVKRWGEEALTTSHTHRALCSTD